MATIHVDIVSAEGEIFRGEAAMVFLHGQEGEIGVAPRHTPLLTLLKPGEVRVQLEDGEELVFFITGGGVEIQPHIVTVLADSAQRAKDLDEAAALQARQRAQDAADRAEGEFEIAAAQSELAIIAAQLQSIERLKKQAKR